MATFVLVHGSYQGGWFWQHVANRMRAAGHQVYAPSLDGCGERKGTVPPGITTETQADEVAQLLFYEDLKDVVLVGTSSGGMVVCRVAELMRDRVGAPGARRCIGAVRRRKDPRHRLPLNVGDGRAYRRTLPRGRRQPAVRRPRSRKPRLGARALHPAGQRHLVPPRA